MIEIKIRIITLKKVQLSILNLIFLLYFAIRPISISLFAIKNSEYDGIETKLVFILFTIFTLIQILFLYKRNNIKDNKYSNNSIDKILITIALISIITTYLVSYFFLPTEQLLYAKRNRSFLTVKQYYLNTFKGTIFYIIILFILGKNYNIIYEQLKRKFLCRLTRILYIAFTFILLYAQIYLGKNNINDQLFNEPGVYLILSDFLALFSIYILGGIKSIWTKIIVFFNSSYWLYKLGSRTSFYIFVIISLIIIIRIILKNKNLKQYLTISFILLGLFIIFEYKIININIDIISDNRMISLLENTKQDSSYVGRQRHMIEGFEDISDNIITGKLFVGVIKDGSLGEYIHNILSYWAEFGLIPFIILLYLCIKYIVINIRYLINNEEYNYLIVGLSLFSIIVCLTSRAYIYPYLWFGLAINIYNTKNHKTTKLIKNK